MISLLRYSIAVSTLLVLAVLPALGSAAPGIWKPSQPGGGRSGYADPDGNQMEFQVDAFASDGCNDFLRGEQMNLNPVGVEFDPEDWLARLRGGASEEDLLVRKVHQPVSPIRGFAGAL